MVSVFDEMNGMDGRLRPPYLELSRWLAETPPDALDHRQREAELLFRRIGITFAVYGDADAQERLIPFDVLPRILGAAEWKKVSAGLEQRTKALNAFVRDVYRDREILKAGIVPEDLVVQNPAFRPEMTGQAVPHDIYVHIGGIDIVRVDAETFYVLEDNARTSSGVSYMLENREIMLRLFPELFARHRIAPVENYPNELLTTLKTAQASHAKKLPNSFVGYRTPRYVTTARPIAPCCATTRFGFHGSAYISNAPTTLRVFLMSNITCFSNRACMNSLPNSSRQTIRLGGPSRNNICCSGRYPGRRHGRSGLVIFGP